MCPQYRAITHEFLPTTETVRGNVTTSVVNVLWTGDELPDVAEISQTIEHQRELIQEESTGLRPSQSQLSRMIIIQNKRRRFGRWLTINRLHI